MCPVWIVKAAELLTVQNEFILQGYGVLEMNVVIARAMYKHKTSFQFGGMCQW